MKTFRFKKKISLVLAVMMLCLTVFGATQGLHVRAEEMITMPKLADPSQGTPLDQSISYLVNDLGFPQDHIVTEAVKTDNPNFNNMVFEQHPEAGAPVSKSDTITLRYYTYSDPTPPTEPSPSPSPEPETDPPTITVPNVINMTQAAVQQSLTENGFGCTIAYEETDNQALNGLVIRTEPAIGTAGLPLGTMVTAFLGQYVPKKVPVPDVTGKTAAEARAAIEALHLTVSIIETETDSENLDQNVYRQEPAGNTEVDEGSGVVLHVYKYEEPETTESETESDETINVDGYEVYKKLRGVSVPKNFVAANDPSTFEAPVEAFYSTVYGTFLYYAEKDGKGGYYLYDKDRNTMFPYVPLSDAEGNSFIASVPADKSEIQDGLIGTTEVDLGTLSNPLAVPAWLVKCPDGTDATVLYLLKSNNTSGFYAFDNKDGITLTPFDEFKREHSSADDASESTGDTAVEPVTQPETETEKESGGFFRKNLIWVVIISAILLLLIVAVFVVYKMSRRQEAMELQEDLRERAAQQEKNRPGRRQYDSSYTNDHAEELEPFDISFENAFPDELGLNNGRKPQEREKGQYVSHDGMLNENAFEDLDRSLADAEERYDTYQEPENRNYIEPGDFGTGHARPKKPQAPDLNDPIIPEDVDDPAPSETIYTKKARSKSGYQELLEDDFEVVDFSKKK